MPFSRPGKLAITQDRVARLCGADAILAKKMTEAERDHDAIVVDSSTTVVQASQYQDLHVALLEACGGVLDVLSPVGVSVKECIGNVPRWFLKVIHHAVRHGASLVLAASFLWGSEDLRDMASGFPPMEKLDDADALAMEFRGAAGAIAESKRVEDVIRSAPHDV